MYRSQTRKPFSSCILSPVGASRAKNGVQLNAGVLVYHSSGAPKFGGVVKVVHLK